MAFEPPSIVVGAEQPPYGFGLLLEPQQAAVLWIRSNRRVYLTVQNLRHGRAVGGKPQNRVGAVAVVVDQMLRDRCRTAKSSAASANRASA